jgi:tetratricopeptide (TPR) repeat protein
MKSRVFTKWAAVAMMTALTVANAFGAEFTLDDLKKMVKELEAVAVKSDKYLYPIECEIVEDEDVNAFATAYDVEGKDKPQAYLAVHTGLIKHVNGDPRLIRAVVAHEVGHLAMGHCRRLKFIAKDFENAWTRQQEFEADAYGASLLQRMGHSRQDVVDMLKMLDGLDGRQGSWLARNTSDHANPLMRAAEVADNPQVFRALVQFDVALAYMDCRQFSRAQELFELAAKMEPKLSEAHINAAQCALMFYWDELPTAYVNSLFRPDFGPFLTDTAVNRGKGNVITADDRENFADALKAIQMAIDKTGSPRAKELQALAWIVNPDKDRGMIQKGLDAYKALRPIDPDESMRFVNNQAVALVTLGNVNDAYALLLAEWRKSESGSDPAAENLGRIKLGGGKRTKDDETMANGIFKVYLSRTPSYSPAYNLLKDAYLASCKELGLTPEDVKPAPLYLTEVVNMSINGKNAGLFDKVDDLVSLFGKADLLIYFDREKFRDLNELRWMGGDFTILTERNQAIRVTSYAPGSSIVLKPFDTSLRGEWKIEVGMPVSEVNKILNVEAGATRELVRGGELENWTYFGGLNFGILVKDDKVAGITVTPVKVPRQG